MWNSSAVIISSSISWSVLDVWSQIAAFSVVHWFSFISRIACRASSWLMCSVVRLVSVQNCLNLTGPLGYDTSWCWSGTFEFIHCLSLLRGHCSSVLTCLLLFPGHDTKKCSYWWLKFAGELLWTKEMIKNTMKYSVSIFNLCVFKYDWLHEFFCRWIHDSTKYSALQRRCSATWDFFRKVFWSCGTNGNFLNDFLAMIETASFFGQSVPRSHQCSRPEWSVWRALSSFFSTMRLLREEKVSQKFFVSICGKAVFESNAYPSGIFWLCKFGNFSH